MNALLVILLSAMILSGCSKKQATPEQRASDLIKPEQDTTWRGGRVLHIEKRHGNYLDGITITEMEAGVKKSIISAKTGLILPWPKEDSENIKVVQLALHDLTIQNGTNTVTMRDVITFLPVQ